MYVHGVARFGLHPQPLGVAVFDISTPLQMLPEPENAGKKLLASLHSLLSPGPDLQLLIPLLYSELENGYKQNHCQWRYLQRNRKLRKVMKSMNLQFTT